MGEGIFLMPIFSTLLSMKLYHVWWRSIMATLAYGPRLIYYTSFLLLGNSIQLDVKGFKLRIQIKTMNMKWMLTHELFGVMISWTIQERNPCELRHLPQRQRVPYLCELTLTIHGIESMPYENHLSPFGFCFQSHNNSWPPCDLYLLTDS
jgi:hypothetical protein